MSNITEMEYGFLIFINTIIIKLMQIIETISLKYCSYVIHSILFVVIFYCNKSDVNYRLTLKNLRGIFTNVRLTLDSFSEGLIFSILIDHVCCIMKILLFICMNFHVCVQAFWVIKDLNKLVEL